MLELPLYDINIYGSWETFIEFWELMGKPQIKFDNSLYDNINKLKKDYYINKIITLVVKFGDWVDMTQTNISIGDYYLTSLTPTFVFITYYPDDYDYVPDDSIPYHDVSLKVLMEIYDYLAK
jgi:hypothetical protein